MGAGAAASAAGAAGAGRGQLAVAPISGAHACQPEDPGQAERLGGVGQVLGVRRQDEDGGQPEAR